MLKPCTICGTMVSRCAAHMKRSPRVFCSHACHGKWQTGRRNHQWKGGTVMRTCYGCQRRFAVKQCEIGRRSAMWCSRDCAAKAKTGRRRSLLVWKKCEQCPTMLLLTPGRARLKRFCSRQCQGLFHRVYLSGARNPRYVHGEGAEEHPADFRKIRPTILRRDQRRCRVCTCREMLQLHHLDQDKSNNEQTNLIALCSPCHRRTHGRGTAVWRRILFWLLKTEVAQLEKNSSISRSKAKTIISRKGCSFTTAGTTR